MPFGRHMIHFHMPNPVLEVVKDGLWSFTAIKDAYVGLQISCYMLTGTNFSNYNRNIRRWGAYTHKSPLASFAGLRMRQIGQTKWDSLIPILGGLGNSSLFFHRTDPVGLIDPLADSVGFRKFFASNVVAVNPVMIVLWSLG